MAPTAKKQKKKWSKGKVKDKAQHFVEVDKALDDRIRKDITSHRLITIDTLVQRYKLNGSAARRALKRYQEDNLIRPVIEHARMKVYTRAVAAAE